MRSRLITFRLFSALACSVMLATFSVAQDRNGVEAPESTADDSELEPEAFPEPGAGLPDIGKKFPEADEEKPVPSLTPVAEEPQPTPEPAEVITQRALDQISTELEAGDPLKIKLNTAQTLLQIGQFHQAEAILEEMSNIDPDSVETEQLRHLVGSLDVIESAMEDMLADQPKNETLYFSLLEQLMKRGKTSDAKAILAKLEENVPKSRLIPAFGTLMDKNVDPSDPTAFSTALGEAMSGEYPGYNEELSSEFGKAAPVEESETSKPRQTVKISAPDLDQILAARLDELMKRYPVCDSLKKFPVGDDYLHSKKELLEMQLGQSADQIVKSHRANAARFETLPAARLDLFRVFIKQGKLKELRKEFDAAAAGFEGEAGFSVVRDALKSLDSSKGADTKKLLESLDQDLRALEGARDRCASKPASAAASPATATAP